MAKVLKHKSAAAGACKTWNISESSLFRDSLNRNSVVFRDLPQKLERFIEVKLDNPLSARYGKHDRPMTGPLTGFWHAHLRDDAILIYNFKDRCVNLVYVATHAEVEGKRCKMTATRLSEFNLSKAGRA
jgi:mRNA-degrading endonuclease YafQ of YafQ-DinJ toxin-antitoxin module